MKSSFFPPAHFTVSPFSVLTCSVNLIGDSAEDTILRSPEGCDAALDVRSVECLNYVVHSWLALAKEGVLLILTHSQIKRSGLF